MNCEWATPDLLFAQLDNEFNFDLDPCCTHETAKCDRHYTKDDDGLSKPWFGNVFMNPPYGREIINWLQKADIESQNGATIVALLPAKTDTSWWHKYCIDREVRFLKGRVKFKGAKHNAPFASAIVIFRPPYWGQ